MIQKLAIIGILGSILCAISDCLLDMKGVDNEKLGEKKYIESKWKTMSPKRFLWSGILVMFAVPMYSCGFLGLMFCLFEKKPELSVILTGIFLCGAMGGFMIHTVLCIAPTIYKLTLEKNDFHLAERILDGIFKQIMFPFFVLYTALVIIPAISVMVLILNGTLPLPLWCVLLNPVIFQMFGVLLRATKCKLFIDVPSICAASLGLGMYGVLALMMVSLV